MSSKHKGLTTAPKLIRAVQTRDTFQTPNYAVAVLEPFIPLGCFRIWEPACGDGKISRALVNFGYAVTSSDLRKSDVFDNEVFNFITDELNVEKRAIIDAIVTNPPYSIKAEFIEKAFEYNLPFAFLINADYSGQQINWIKRGCEKIIPTRRINYITPFGRQGETSGSQFHSMWLTYGFNLGRTETFVDLPIKEIKENI